MNTNPGTDQAAAHSTSSVRRWALGLGVALCGAFALAVWAAPDEGMMPHREGGHEHCMDRGAESMMPGLMGHHMDRMLKDIKATDAQRAQIRAIEEATAKDLKAQHEAARALHDKVLALLSQPTIDEAGAESLRQQMQAQHDAMSKRVMQSFIAVAKVLTPEQRQQLAEKMKAQHEKMWDHWKRQRPDTAASGASS